MGGRTEKEGAYDDYSRDAITTCSGGVQHFDCFVVFQCRHV